MTNKLETLCQPVDWPCTNNRHGEEGDDPPVFAKATLESEKPTGLAVRSDSTEFSKGAVVHQMTTPKERRTERTQH